MRKKTTLAVVIFAALVLGLILFSTLSLGGYSCEVCMEFHGQQRCRTAKGSTREEARKTAIDNACAFLAGGVTDSIACTNTLPKSVRCQ
ncbi:MAG: hypothetical protein HY238_19415 [Acidobacteria bacterium]|nr:hypothetical protein [Acidobacteriota bacterium]